MNSYCLLVMDSCRFDTMRSCWAELSFIPRIGHLQKAYSFTTWTLSSHILYTLGRLPWRERETLGMHKVHTEDLRHWDIRFGARGEQFFGEGFDFKSRLNSYGLPINAITSANPLMESGPFSLFTDSLVNVGNMGNCFERALNYLPVKHPQFLIMNVCETHYPYYYGEYSEVLRAKKIPGFGRIVRGYKENDAAEIPTFSSEDLRLMRKCQASAVKYLDNKMRELIDLFPKDTYITITSDHGDAFGEDGFIGHGEVWSKSVLEVPFVEGPLSNFFES